MPPERTQDEKKSSEPSSANEKSEKNIGASAATTNQKQKQYFLGFEDPSSKLRELWCRWKALEDWIELAVRPRNCHPDDRHLLDGNDSCIDDLSRLKKQGLLVQGLFNDHLSKLSVETTLWESSLVVRPSQIAGAGMGLYYQPPATEEPSLQDQNFSESERGVLPSGSIVCYYTGHVHTHSSASGLTDKSYLMWIRGNTLVDPRPLHHIKARYANDPLNDDIVNCSFVPTKLRNNHGNTPYEDTIRTSIVTTRDILPGEELFVQYGEVYWNKQPITGSRLVLGSKEEINSDYSVSGNDEEGIDDDLDETFPFSPLFQSKLTKPILWEDAGSSKTEQIQNEESFTAQTGGKPGGDGASLSSPCCFKRAALALHEADYLLVLAGAGMSADSGLGTYETMPSRYREFCDPARLATQSTLEEFSSFWKAFALQYASTKPHEGYSIIDRWCHGQKLKRLSLTMHNGDFPLTSDKRIIPTNRFPDNKWWVYTSNVDGHFRRFQSFHCRQPKDDFANCYNNVCEIHGCAGEFRCSCGIGYFDREKFPRMGTLWERWNECVKRIRLSEGCETNTETLKELQERQSKASGSQNCLPSCRDCKGLPLRPNVLMFNDTDENVLASIQDHRRNYQDWEAMVESKVCDPVINANLVLVEIGCGTNVPAVRIESEEVLADTLDGLNLVGDSFGGGSTSSAKSKGSVTLLRINSKEAGTQQESLLPHVVSIYENSLSALQKIDKELDLIIGAEQ